MDAFDAGILHFLNQFAQKCWLFDEVVSFIAVTPLRGAAMIALVWWLWFREVESQARDRALILAGLAGSSVALFVARALAVILPFRERPFCNPALYFRHPYGTDLSSLLNWSSFPSDHAVFYFAIATSIFFLSKKAGTLAYLYAFFVICLPRIYLGVHYPTDILIGAAIGIAIACLSEISRLREIIARRPLRWLQNSPGAFYATFFIASFLFSTHFDSLRSAATSSWHAVHVGLRVTHLYHSFAQYW